MVRFYKGDTAVYLRKDGAFEIRIPIPSGTLSKEQMGALAEVTDRCGREVHLTVRQGVQVMGVPEDSLDEALSILEGAGLRPGSTGRRVRNVLACPGDEYCFKATQDTRGLAEELGRELGGREMPAKFKVAISGCPFACTWPQMNDIGLMGRVRPTMDPQACIACGACVKACPAKAITMVDGHASIDDDECARCGRCAEVCMHGAISLGEPAFMLTVGGRGSWRPKEGYVLHDMLPRDEVLPTVLRIMEVYSEGADKERLREFIDSIGLDEFKARLQGKG